MQQRYFPHLDGLRAIAVGLVVLYHAGFSTISAGYIGVDVFFVLSGFLITGQLVKQLDDRQFSFAQFYMRRIRRLAPAFVVVTVACLLAGALILLPDDFIYLSRLGALGMVSAGNFYLANTTGGYFKPDTDEIALLHTWSLAVEEQYYLIWPLLLILLWKMPGYRRHLLMVVGLFIASVAFSVWYTQADSSRAYFLLPARFHELLLGGLLAMVWSRLPELSRGLRELLCWSGLALILVPALTWNAEVAFPGIRALFPCLGTALLIYAGKQPSLIHQLLTRRAMIGLGLLSYSLYLWHWPVFSFTRYAMGELSTTAACIGTLVSVLLSYLTWRFVEKPFRFRWTFGPGKTAALLFAVPTLALSVAAVVIYKGEGFVGRFGDGAQEKIAAIESKASNLAIACPTDPAQPCADILLAGDSHAGHFGDFMSVLAKDAGLSLNVVWQASCPLYAGLYPMIGGDVTNAACPQHNAKLLEQASQYRYVALAGFWSVSDYKGDEYFFVRDPEEDRSQSKSAAYIAQGLRESIQAIVESGSIPVIIYDNAAVTDKQYKCPRMNLSPFYNEECAFPRSQMDNQQADKRALFAMLADEFPRLRFIDPTPILCDMDRCYTERDGIPLYKDYNHLNKHGSLWLGRSYLARFGNPFREFTGE